MVVLRAKMDGAIEYKAAIDPLNRIRTTISVYQGWTGPKMNSHIRKLTNLRQAQRAFFVWKRIDVQYFYFLYFYYIGFAMNEWLISVPFFLSIFHWKETWSQKTFARSFPFCKFPCSLMNDYSFNFECFFFSVTSWVHKGTHTGSLALNKNGCGMWWEEGLCAGKSIPALVSHCATLLQAKDGEDGQPLSLTYSLGSREVLVDGNVRGWAQDNHCGAGWMCWSHSF